MGRFVIAFLIVSHSAWCAVAEEDARVARGKELANTLCTQCHAIGAMGQSPNPAAPTFRKLGERLDLDTFMDRLRQGLTSGHADMPTFRFTREDARALVSYLRAIQRP